MNVHKIKRITEHDQTVMKWGFSNDSTLLFTSDMSGKTLVHTTNDGKMQTSFSTYALAFTPNSNFLIDADLRVWNTKTGRLFSGPIGPSFQAIGITVTEDNQLTAINRENSIVRRALDETSSLNTLLSIAEKRIRKSATQNQKPRH